MKERDLFDLLLTRYSGEDWALVPQVPSETGGSGKRTADAIAMSLWPSRGLELHGFEIKVSRSDWLKELNGTGAKADAIAKYCDRWWIVAADATIVKKEELPKAWGLMVKRGDGLAVKVQSPLNESAKQIDRELLAGLMRASLKYHSKIYEDDAIEKRIAERFEAGREAERTILEYQHRRELEKLKDTQQAVIDFEKASGITINSYTDGKQLAAMVQLAKKLGGGRYDSALSVVSRVSETVDELRKELEEIASGAIAESTE